jgi:hypothetical protein
MNKSIFEVDPSFANQAGAQRGGTPSTPAFLPAHSPVELRTPDFADLARRSAPGSAVSADMTYRWR